MSPIRDIPFHVRIGRCSGFRWCCITFFTLVWAARPRTDFARYTRGWRQRYRDWIETRAPIPNLRGISSSSGWSHIPCPLCAWLCRRTVVNSCGPSCDHGRPR